VTDQRQGDLGDHLAVLWRWKWLIVAGTAACVLVTGVVTFFMPRVYRIEMILDTGDLSGPQVQAVDRLVARLASPVTSPAKPDGGGLVLGAEFRPPFMVVIRTDTRVPAEAVGPMRDVAAAVLNDLNRIGKKQQDDVEMKVTALRARVEALRHDLDLQIDELRSEAGSRLRGTRTRLDFVTGQVKSLRQERGLLEQRAASLRQTIKELSGLRAEALRQGDPARAAALLAELGRGIEAAEADLLKVEREVTADIPLRLARMEREERAFTEAVVALETLGRALQPARIADGSGLDRIRDSVSQAILTGVVDGSTLTAMTRRIEFELIDHIKRAIKETDTLLRDAPPTRAPQLLMPPQAPGFVVQPRRKVALAVSGVVGLVSSVLLAFVAEYVGGVARRRKAPGGPEPGLGAEARPGISRDPA
jgi:hypothetical protein